MMQHNSVTRLFIDAHQEIAHYMQRHQRRVKNLEIQTRPAEPRDEGNSTTRKVRINLIHIHVSGILLFYRRVLLIKTCGCINISNIGTIWN